MTNKVRIRRLNEKGINEFQSYYDGGGLGDYDPQLLTSEDTSELIPEICSEIDLDQKFKDRFYIAQEIVKVIGKELCQKHRHDKGLWDWFSLAFFSQVRRSPLSKPEHYLLSEGNNWIIHRHCIAGPVRLYEKFGESSRLLISDKIDTMGEMLEQTLSRQYLMQSKNFLEVMKKLYQNPITLCAKSGAASKVSRKRLKNGEWSKQGWGSSRRLAIEIQRIRLTFNIDELDPDYILELYGGPKRLDSFHAELSSNFF